MTRCSQDDIDTLHYLGFDLSTQKLKAVILDNQLNIVTTAEVQYDTDLPEYRTVGGVSNGPSHNEYFVNPVMWIKAIDIVLERLILQGADFSHISCLSGSAQQHGGIFWSSYGINVLQNLNPDKFLHLQLDESAFSVIRSPIWMDSSTDSQCMEMEMAIGGSEKMLTITGSRCYPRFTGPQIRKIYQKRTLAYENTDKISLVSSFFASIFLGCIAPIDFADASGMNLFDVNEKKWSKICLNACAPDLEQRLEEPIESNSILGNINSYFVNRFGFSETCKIAAFTGDNPSVISGMLVDANSLILSLGTSDTILMSFKHHPKLQDGHVFCHPTDKNLFMGMLCFRNGSLVREHIKNEEADGSWGNFNMLLESTPRGNFGNIGIYFKDAEIIPPVKGILKWSKETSSFSKDASYGIKRFSSPEVEIRALIEGQMLHHKTIATDLGFHFDNQTKVIATGGASVNQSILQVVADVFNAPVYTQKNCEAALIGAAYRAKYALYLEKETIAHSNPILSYQNYIKQFVPKNLTLESEPHKDSLQIYNPMVERYRVMSQILLQNQ